MHIMIVLFRHCHDKSECEGNTTSIKMFTPGPNLNKLHSSSQGYTSFSSSKGSQRGGLYCIYVASDTTPQLHDIYLSISLSCGGSLTLQCETAHRRLQRASSKLPAEVQFEFNLSCVVVQRSAPGPAFLLTRTKLRGQQSAALH